MRIAVFLVAVFALSASAMAQQQRDVVRADDSHAIQSCIKEKDGKEGADRCIGIVANPCLDSPAGQSTHGQADCYRREHAVWDDILNETYRRLQGSFEGKLKAQLRDVQRSWIEARKFAMRLLCRCHSRIACGPDFGELYEYRDRAPRALSPEHPQYLTESKTDAALA